jgi:hypothetical protein
MRKTGPLMPAAGAVLTLLVAGCTPEFMNLEAGTQGRWRTYGMRLFIEDARSGRELADVAVIVDDGVSSPSEIHKGTTSEGGRTSFSKRYYSRLVNNYAKPEGYPTEFVITAERKGYKTLELTVPVESYEIGKDDRLASPRYAIKLVRGKGLVKKKDEAP